MNKDITVICGDGIGPEVTCEAVKVLDTVANCCGHTFAYEYILAGGASLDKCGVSLTEEALEKVLSADAVLLGALGGPKWDGFEDRPEKALLKLRKSLGVFANLRPAVLYPELETASPLKKEILDGGVDILVVRELTGGLYYGKRGSNENGTFDTMEYSDDEIGRVLRYGFEAARIRKKHLTLVDKANILTTSKRWRKFASEMEKEYSDVTTDYMYVDNAAMQLVKHPSFFDVIVTENTFGDILSDETGAIVGSLGLLPSASLGYNGKGLYEPVHGSAPDIAGKGIADPLAAILSAAMMLDYSFGLHREAEAVRFAVHEAITDAIVTPDISAGEKAYTTKEVGSYVCERIKNVFTGKQ